MSQPAQSAGVAAKLQMTGVLEYRDAAGQVVARVPFTGSVPLTGEQVAQLSTIEDPPHGSDHLE